MCECLRITLKIVYIAIFFSIEFGFDDDFSDVLNLEKKNQQNQAGNKVAPVAVSARTK